LIFEPLPIPGAWSVRLEPRRDERGYFARSWCQREFAAHGIEIDMVQSSLSHNARAGTLRGMHYARPPSSEGKLVRCERGRILDVLLDLRPDSPAYLRHAAVELVDRSGDAVYVPPGVAHGFQTLEDDTDVLYMMSDFYRPELDAGVRFDDPAFGIRWPLPVTLIAPRDRGYPDFVPADRGPGPRS
jgi:dTDP-4-dehydrorhamnose 3,5-epimerase